jgi:cell division protein YceG involved in septum cleavage
VGRNLEGYLMPETYFVNSGVNEKQLIKMMYGEFNKKVTYDMHRRAERTNVSFKDVVIMVSII